MSVLEKLASGWAEQFYVDTFIFGSWLNCSGYPERTNKWLANNIVHCISKERCLMTHELRSWATSKVKYNGSKDRKLENVFLIKIQMSADAFWAYF